MGKGEGKKKKGKEFSATPFAGIKGMHVEMHAPPALPEKALPLPEKPDRANEDELFLREMSDVRALRPVKKSLITAKTPPVKTKKSAVSVEDSRLFLDTVDKLKLDVRFTEALADVKPLRTISESRSRQLKRGAIRIDLELDLHGLTRDEAIDALAAFVTSAYNRDRKAVLVITGKGNNSPEEPVLLTAVSAWLREQGKGKVAEFTPAPRQLGGGGAFVVFLKKRE